jgi:hypothetical protein
VRDLRRHGLDAGEFGLQQHPVARGVLAKAGGGHQQVHAQRVQRDQTQQRPVFHALAGLAVALDDGAGKWRAHHALVDLRTHHFQVRGEHGALAAALHQLLLGQPQLGVRLLDSQWGDEALLEQLARARMALLRQFERGLGGTHLGLDAPAGAGRALPGALDLVAQRDEPLALTHRVAHVDGHFLDDARDRRADVGHPVRADEATDRGRNGPGGCAAGR